MIVLTVDDSDINLAVYRSVLERIDDVRVQGFTDPIKALDWVEENPPEVAVIDYHMPQLDGLRFVEQLRGHEASRDTLVVVVTADVEPDVRHRALSAGVNDFLTKPIDPIEFGARMRNLLELSNSRRHLADRAEWLHQQVEAATSLIAEREIETILRLTRAAEFRDDITGMHVIRVGHITATLARTLGMPDGECRKLLLAAPMHDIGKVATPDRILLKPGPLTTEEFDVMKQHTISGYEILKDSQSEMLQCAAEIALTHHERFDGGGYPRALRGDAIPMSGRLCSVADVFDALTSARPYKPAWPIGQAVEAIDFGGGTQFDPEIVQTFHRAFEEILAIKERFSKEDERLHAAALLG